MCKIMLDYVLATENKKHVPVPSQESNEVPSKHFLKKMRLISTSAL